MTGDAQITTASPTALRVDMMRGPRLAAVALLLAVLALLATAVFWASRAELDEATSGTGRVIPSGEIQVVQTLEGGIVSDILVKEGDTVDKGQVLLRIDDTTAAAEFRETRETHAGVLASVIRLTAEAENKELAFPEQLKRQRPELVVRETELFNTRKAVLASSLAILRQQHVQRLRQLEEEKSKLTALQKSQELAREEYDLSAPMAEQGMVSRVEMLQLERALGDLEARIESAKIAIPRAEAAVAEAEQRIKERINSVRSKALAELNERQVRLAALAEGLKARQDRVTRTEVRSPVRGVVKQMHFNTIGGVAQPGEDMLEIVPLEEALLVEARISPADVAFLHPGQSAKVRLTAYDFSIYGGLDAVLEQISADTIVDEQGHGFYRIRVRTDKSYLDGKNGGHLPIIAGMVAEVDILTGKKTVLDYLLKPFAKARHKALRER